MIEEEDNNNNNISGTALLSEQNKLKIEDLQKQIDKINKILGVKKNE